MMTKYPSEPKGRRNFDTALRYNTVDMIATEKTRTEKPARRPKAMGRRAAVRATCFFMWRSPVADSTFPLPGAKPLRMSHSSHILEQAGRNASRGWRVGSNIQNHSTCSRRDSP